MESAINKPILRPRSPLIQKSDSGRIILERMPEIDYILEMALDEGRRMTKAKRANFYFFSSDGNLAPFLNNDIEPEKILAICNYCIENRTGVILPRGMPFPPDGEDKSKPSFELPFSIICTHLILREGDLGAILLAEPLYFDHFFDSDLSLLSSFGASFSLMVGNGWQDRDYSDIYLDFRTGLLLLMENAQLHQKIKESDVQLEAVLEVSNLINSSRELTEMIETILYSARKVARAESASLFLMDEETGELYFDIVSGSKSNELAGIRIPQGKGIAGQAALHKVPILVNDAQRDPRFYGNVDKISQMTTRNLIAAPLLVDGHTIGVIEVLNTIDRPTFSEHDLEIFQSFSDAVAIAIQRRRLLDDLQNTNLQLEKKLSEVTSLHSVAAALVEATSIEQLFRSVLRIIINDLGVGRASILLHSKTRNRLEMVASEGNYSSYPEESLTEDQEGRLSDFVFQNNRPIYMEDIHEDERFRPFASPGRYRTGSCILIPLSASNSKEPFGVICVSEPKSGRFGESDFRLLNTITSQMVRGYENFKLTEEILAKKAMEKEVEITSKIQQNILPEGTPSHAHIDVAARSVMAKTIGGDFYDFYAHEPNGDITFLVADVSGKSLPAALFMAISSSILRTIIRSEKNPTRVLALANDLLYEESQTGMFVTVFLARYEPGVGMIRFASAGHNEMLLIHQDGTYNILSGKGAPLGVIPAHQQKFRGGEAKIAEGDLLVLYTDGIVEAINSENHEYGLPRFIAILQENLHRTPEEIIDIIYKSVVQFSGSDLQYDDFTLLITRFRGTIQGSKNYHITLPARVESIPVLRDFISQLCLRHGLSGQDLDDVLLASDEAATNIVLHAFKKSDMENPTFECDLTINSHEIFRIQFTDRGEEFNLENVREPDLKENLAGRRKGGFGVYLIRSLMDHLEYVRKDGKNYLIAEKFLNRDR